MLRRACHCEERCVRHCERNVVKRGSIPKAKALGYHMGRTFGSCTWSDGVSGVREVAMRYRCGTDVVSMWYPQS